MGSANVDLVATVASRPAPGETVHALDYAEFVGGKGSNQAIAAARLGGRVAFVGMVGDDPEADMVRKALSEEGVDIRGLGSEKSIATGRALVVVDDSGENSIVVVAGANARVGSSQIAKSRDLLSGAAIVVAQLEIPIATVIEAALLTPGMFVLNPAPAQPLPSALLRRVDVLVVNQVEYEIVTGRELPPQLPELARDLRQLDLPKFVVITLGGRGALVWDSLTVIHVAPPSVQVVDTTGAGDTFIGALAEALSRGETIASAARWAVHAASLSVTTLGATTGMPRHEDVVAALNP
ncbi:ribokinase [Mycetocola sp.]|uniref:ribokinase n=1 Tax=Mycetocola sp. TaxID=1871042 RepID=UPI003988D748